jgi:hypothetical protein
VYWSWLHLLHCYSDRKLCNGFSSILKFKWLCKEEWELSVSQSWFNISYKFNYGTEAFNFLFLWIEYRSRTNSGGESNKVNSQDSRTKASKNWIRMCWKLELIQALLTISITSVLWTKTFCVWGGHAFAEVHYVIDGYWEHLQPTSQSVSFSKTTWRSSLMRDFLLVDTMQFYLMAVFSVMSSSEFLESQKTWWPLTTLKSSILKCKPRTLCG